MKLDNKLLLPTSGVEPEAKSGFVPEPSDCYVKMVKWNSKLCISRNRIMMSETNKNG